MYNSSFPPSVFIKLTQWIWISLVMPGHYSNMNIKTIVHAFKQKTCSRSEAFHSSLAVLPDTSLHWFGI